MEGLRESHLFTAQCACLNYITPSGGGGGGVQSSFFKQKYNSKDFKVQYTNVSLQNEVLQILNKNRQKMFTY